MALIALERKLACGNCATWNHSGFFASVSVSVAPKLTLPVSMVKPTLPAAGFFGSKRSCACHCAKRPSTGTPIWRVVKAISLPSRSTVCAAAGAAATAAANRRGTRRKLMGACATAGRRGR